MAKKNILPTKEQFDIIDDILKERANQDKKWGKQNHPCLDQVLINREGHTSRNRMCEEYEIPTENRAKYKCNTAAEKGEVTFAHIAIEELSEVVSEFDIHKRRLELVQLTAVCMQWLEAIDRKINTPVNQ